MDKGVGYLVIGLVLPGSLYLMQKVIVKARKNKTYAKSVKNYVSILTVLPLLLWFLPSSINSNGELSSIFNEAHNNPIIFVSAALYILSAAIIFKDYKKYLRLAFVLYLLTLSLTFWITLNVFDSGAVIPSPNSYLAALEIIIPCIALLGMTILNDLEKKK